MPQVLTPSLIAAKRHRVRRVRELPVTGRCHCKVGDTIGGTEIVASAELLGELEILRIGEQLGIEPYEVVKSMRVTPGSTVQQGEVLCEHVGLFGLLRNRYPSPVSGTVEFIAERTGHVGVRLAPGSIELSAYISGTVVAVEDGKSVTVESVATFIQGVFGVGGERQGRLKVLKVPSDKSIEPRDLPVDCAGLVLVGGKNVTDQALRQAGLRGAAGLVTGSIDDQVLKNFLGFDLGVAVTGDEDIPLSLIITEGFGDIPISGNILELLQEHDGKPVSINGATQVRAGAVRPEIIVPISGDGDEVLSAASTTGLEVGRTIRLIRYPYFGLRAVVTELPPKPERIETGTEARVLRAKLLDGREVVVPRANIELVEE